MKKLNFAFILALVVVVFVFFILFYSELKGSLVVLASAYGLVGIFLLTVIMDTLVQPISPDILVIGATFGGANLFAAAIVVGIASCLAGVFGYFIGHKIGAAGFEKWFGKKHLAKGEGLFKKYGVFAVIVGALSPIPYSSVCWTAGIYDMDFPAFLITSLLTRIPRFLLMGLIGAAI